MLDALDAPAVRRWATVTRAALAARRGGIDALNVFPVDDGDTGTNLVLTFDGALSSRGEPEGHPLASGGAAPTALAAECAAVARACLLTARGNSGVILSQLLGGFAEEVRERGVDPAGPDVVADALDRAARRARDCVARPVEGTILSVARACADAALEVARSGGTLPQLSAACVRAADAALARTPDQLEVLAAAGVVDAGGAGYLVFAEALDRVVRDVGGGGRFAVDAHLAGRPDRPPSPPVRAGHRPEATAGRPGRAAVPPGSVEVMYLLEDASAEDVDRLRRTLDDLGDSLIVVGGPDLWNVHVHVDDAGGAVEAGLAAGRPRRIRVTPLRDRARVACPGEAGVVACAAGPGVAEALEDAGAVTVPSGTGRRASAGQLLDAVRSTHAADVILLPNDRDTLLSAEAAARAASEEGVAVHVVPSTTAVQGLAALAVHSRGRPVEQQVVAMTGAAAATRHGGVTVATRAGLTSGGPCEPGDVLGVVGGDVTVVGSGHVGVAAEVVRRLLASGGELVTVLVGADAPAGLAEALVDAVRGERRDVEIHVLDGGQPTYDLLLGVE